MKVESPATLRSLGVDMLKKLGIDRVADRTKVYEVWDMVRRRLRILGITLVWIDEAQDMFKETLAAETQSMFKMLKGLMQGDHPVVVVLSGTDRLGEITKVDAQVNRRFSKIRPSALEFGVHNEAIETFTRGFAKKAGLDMDLSGETINRIIRAGRHRFGRSIELILMAVECALRDGADTLRIEHFELAFGIHEGCEITANIFAVTDWTALVLDDDEAEPAAPVKKKGATRARKMG
ncbi:TniB family NTP-binding protein [Nioella sp.]|uniref:TniB family NTP-binding protein n=1 Tax=Nioella sp. TaxID=1912091 RepID=UPI003514E3D5